MPLVPHSWPDERFSSWRQGNLEFAICTSCVVLAEAGSQAADWTTALTVVLKAARKFLRDGLASALCAIIALMAFQYCLVHILAQIEIVTHGS